MKNEELDEDILYFEQLAPNIQDAVIEFIVSIIENKMKNKEE